MSDGLNSILLSFRTGLRVPRYHNFPIEIKDDIWDIARVVPERERKDLVEDLYNVAYARTAQVHAAHFSYKGRPVFRRTCTIDAKIRGDVLEVVNSTVGRNWFLTNFLVNFELYQLILMHKNDVKAFKEAVQRDLAEWGQMKLTWVTASHILPIEMKQDLMAIAHEDVKGKAEAEQVVREFHNLAYCYVSKRHLDHFYHTGKKLYSTPRKLMVNIRKDIMHTVTETIGRNEFLIDFLANFELFQMVLDHDKDKNAFWNKMECEINECSSKRY